MRWIAYTIFTLTLIACKKESTPVSSTNCSCDELLWEYTDSEGVNAFIYENGDLYLQNENSCDFFDQYFDPAFASVYVHTDSGIFISHEGDLIPTLTEYYNDFESETEFLDLIAGDLTELDEVWTNFTLQSPAAPTVSDYNALQQCILDGTCDFIDNRIDLAEDPQSAGNQVLKFTSASPTDEMVTSKCSISSDLFYFEKGDDIWFEAKYLIDSEYPSTLVDFESSYFLQYPGPRALISGGNIAIENKFGEKFIYRQEEGGEVPLPIGEWFTLKIHLTLDDISGTIQVWQDNQLVLDTEGRNIPLPISIQNSLEFGISATSYQTALYVDDLRISMYPF